MSRFRSWKTRRFVFVIFELVASYSSLSFRFRVPGASLKILTSVFEFECSGCCFNSGALRLMAKIQRSI